VRAFRNAHEWATGVTGDGVLEHEGKILWKAKVRQHVDYHCNAVDPMANREGSMPKCTNEDPSNLDKDADDDGPDFPFTEDE